MSNVNRAAIVIGNSEYAEGRLTNPHNDAKEFDEKLRGLNFGTVMGFDIDRDGFYKLITEFEHVYPNVTVALLFYAGHGIQFGQKNYMLPVESRLRQMQDLSRDGVELEPYISLFGNSSKTKIVLLDCCRNNPFVDSLASNVKPHARHLVVRPGLAELRGAQGSYIVFATRPNETADEGLGPHSPFSQALLNHVEKPNQTVMDMMIDVTNDVLQATNNRQQPWAHSSLVEKFMFNPPGPTVQATAPLRPPDEQDWLSIQASNSIFVFEEFLNAHPTSKLRVYAEARIKDIRSDNKSLQKTVRYHPHPRPGGLKGAKKFTPPPTRKRYGHANMLDADLLRRLIGISMFSTARVVSRDGTGMGSAFVVSGADVGFGSTGGMFLFTAAHVISAGRGHSFATSSADALISFDGLIEEGKLTGPIEIVRTAWESSVDNYDAVLLDIGGDLDGLLLPIEIAPDLPEFDPASPLEKANRPAVFSISYPYGGPVRFGNVDNYLLDYERPAFDATGRPVDRPVKLHYTAASEPGSSGCPILNEHLQIMAMHQGGGDYVPRLNGIDGTYAANYGLWIQSTLANVRRI
jgi:hypothetical protein